MAIHLNGSSSKPIMDNYTIADANCNDVSNRADGQSAVCVSFKSGLIIRTLICGFPKRL